MPRFDTMSPPPPRDDPTAETTAAEAADDARELDPREAAALLEQTRAQAERAFEARPAAVPLVAAVTVLVAYGAVWLSVRHQHPYDGPSGAALGVLYGALAIWIVFMSIVGVRPLRGRSSSRRRLEGVVFASIWICVYVFQGALYHAGHSRAIAYGVYPAVAPLIVVGAAAAGYQAARGNRVGSGFAAAAVVLGAFAAFAGPSEVWLVVGIGLVALLVAGCLAPLWRAYHEG